MVQVTLRNPCTRRGLCFYLSLKIMLFSETIRSWKTRFSETSLENPALGTHFQGKIDCYSTDHEYLVCECTSQPPRRKTRPFYNSSVVSLQKQSYTIWMVVSYPGSAQHHKLYRCHEPPPHAIPWCPPSQ